MKQHKNNRDEQLYQQILAELKPGADEYDRIMAQGKQPVAMPLPPACLWL